MMIIPEGFAHGFQALEDNTEIFYPCTESYFPQFEEGILFNDKSVNIKWPIPATEISKKDLSHKLISKKFKGLNLK